MKYYIYAMEGMYNGLHGLNSTAIVECDNIEEASDIATDMSMEIMNDYNIIYDELEKEVQEFANDNGYDLEDDEVLEYEDGIFLDNVDYIVMPLSYKYQHWSIEDLEQLSTSNPEEFLKEYCDTVFI